MRSALILAATFALALAACGGNGGEADPPPATTPAGSTQPVPVPGDAITGTFGGDARLEGGCAWVDDGQTRWEVQYPQGYEVTFDPLTLTGPNGETAGEGDTLTIAGAEQTDAVSLCQVGPLWAATSVQLEG